MFKLNVVAIVFGEIWQLRECRVGAILLVFVDNRANFPIHTHRTFNTIYLSIKLNYKKCHGISAKLRFARLKYPK